MAELKLDKKSRMLKKLNYNQHRWHKVCVYGVLIALVLLSATMVVVQVFDYRRDYRALNSYIREKEDLNAEWGRLLIEQQTFGATAQIGNHAVSQLRMFSPPTSQTVVISLPMSTEQNK